MTQTFEGAQPKVVRQKQKFKDTSAYNTYTNYEDEEDDRQALNIMYDKRVFRGNTHNANLLKQNMTPAQKEEQRIKMEREKKKVEMIKKQLLEFKKSKSKTKPYDLRPGPPARIEVDLTYFLTEQGRAPPEEQSVKTQTDEFKPKPPSPKYVPKKTGIDKITQIGDYDLFNYDREVQPILNVLLTKSVEQAILEVEEETELSQIRKFKQEYQKRQENNHAQWDQEVKREISLINKKNKTLNNARAKREQQIKTMHKLQCLNISKKFLSGCFMGTMKQLAEHSYWRDSFKDQLTVAFKDQLLSSVLIDTQKFDHSGSLLDSLVAEQLDEFGKAKQRIKSSMVAKQNRREKSRLIESADRRIVHFIFNPNQPVKISPFTRKFVKLMEGPEELEEFEKTEAEAFDQYIEAISKEEDDATDPVVFGPNPFYELELKSLHRLAFAVADNPFMKTDSAKYYPEVHVVLQDGTLMTTISPNNKSDSNFGSSVYMENFRDDHLKINDDRKVRLTLSDFKDRRNMMILLTVRCNDLKGQAIDPSSFAQAWFRLQNEDTNQTLDYSYIDKVKQEAGIEEEGEAEEEELEEGEEPVKKEQIFLAGRLYREDTELRQPPPPEPKEGEEAAPIPEKKYKTRWIYERWNRVVSSADFPDVAGKLGELYSNSRKEIRSNKERVKEAKAAVQRAAEEKKALLAAAAAKKAKAAKKGSKKTEEAPAEEEDKKFMPVTAQSEDGDLNLNDPADFAKALTKEVPRPFTFGPIEFTELNLTEGEKPFDADGNKHRIIDSLDLHMAQPSCCIRGHTVQIKGRNLKRRSTMLKHGRFMQNLVVSPVYPKLVEAVEEEGEEEAGEESAE